MRRLVSALAVCALSLGVVACGDDDAPGSDGGTDLGRDASGPCAVAADCNDGLYCNGTEVCAPGAAVADARGCLAGTPPSCDVGSVCDEATDACGGCGSIDNDSDGDSACTDCDDNDANRYHGNTEVCDYPTNRDEDCDPTTFGSKDSDGDLHVDARCCNGTSCGDDCDDTRGGTHPGVPEVCNGRDDDCNGLVDDDGVQVPGYADADRDLYGDPTAPISACAGSGGLSSNSTDCLDIIGEGGYASPAFEEILGDGIDNDCDGTTDETGGPAATWYLDEDGDGFGVAGSTMTSSTVLVGYALLAGDCDDTDPTISPIAPEICNGIDDDCNGVADFAIGINDWEDDDHDGFVDSACGGGAGSDCDDGDPNTRPGATEICDGRDNDCDGTVDEGVCSTSVDAGVRDGATSGRCGVEGFACCASDGGTGCPSDAALVCNSVTHLCTRGAAMTCGQELAPCCAADGGYDGCNDPDGGSPLICVSGTCHTEVAPMPTDAGGGAPSYDAGGSAMPDAG
jgi:hypothetical protein